MIENLHFIRPSWFYAFIPLVIFILILFFRHGNSMGWKTVCDAKLLPYILNKKTKKSSRLPLLLVAFTASISIIAAAGPAFEKLPKPVYKEQSTLVILMDLSQSMDASDLKPSRLERAKLKLLDILKTRKAGQTALIVYAADAFVVTPITDDTNTIANLVPTLQTGLMPSQGSHAYIAIEKSLSLLRQAGANQADILLITDDITERDQEAINDLTSKGLRLSVLGVGTEEGSPISLNGGFLQDSSGSIVIPKLEPENLQRAASNGGGIYVNLRADDTDLNTLNTLFFSRKVQDDKETKNIELTADIWQEEGPWLLLLILPLVALWFRKGWLLCFLFFVLPAPEQAYAFDIDHLWSSPDQKAMRAFNNGKTDEAATQFKDNRWKAASHYQSGDYEQALESLRNPTTSNDHYNRGNALAKLGRYPEAIKAYDEALNLDSNNKDASFNREQVEYALKKQQQQSDDSSDKEKQGDESGDSDKNQQNNEDGQKESSGDKESENNQDQKNADANKQTSSESEQQASKNKAENKNSKGDFSDKSDDSMNQAAIPEPDKNKVEQALKDAQKSAEEDAKNQAEDNNEDIQQTSQIEKTEVSEDDQAVEQWLKRVPDNPDQLLLRKFLYQYKNMDRKTPSDQSW